MAERRRGSGGGSRQPDLFAQPKISLPDNHPMVVLTDTVDWTEMEVWAEKIRAKKLKNAAGRPPQLRATLGALTLMALRRLPYREVEEQIRYYAPARYLCGLTETDWTPDFTTIQDFAQLMGEDGVKLINEGVVEQAVKLGLADAKVVVLFGKAPRSYAYDRAGHSERNIDRLREIGVRDVGLAPRGNTPWEVEALVKARLIKERALVEGSIGTIKCPKYGFNRPAARSVAMMGVCGQRAVLGLNLTKLARGAARNSGVALAS